MLGNSNMIAVTVAPWLRKLRPSILGILGGTLGIFASVSFYGVFASACCGFEYFALLAIFGVLGAALGITGGVFASIWRRVGGLILFGATVVTIALWLPFLVYLSPLGWMFFIIGFAWWVLPILLGGLLAFPKSRRILKQLHNDGWLP
jgi:hypothetical protein